MPFDQASWERLVDDAAAKAEAFWADLRATHKAPDAVGPAASEASRQLEAEHDQAEADLREYARRYQFPGRW